MPQAVSVVCSVLNERMSLDALIDSLLLQTRPPDRIVIVDGGSRDGTMERIEQLIESGAPIQLIRLPGSNISQARNAGIRASSTPIIAVTDCGVRLDSRWLEFLLAPFEEMPEQVDVVSGFFRADPRNAFEVALGATTLIDESDIDPEKFLPSSRSVAFTRESWLRVGGYPEWLEHSEDVLFDLELKKAGARFVFEPKALVHFQPRTSLKTFALQYFRYARGDGKANLWWSRHIVRYLVYILGPALVIMAARRPRLYLAVLLGGGYYLARPYRRLGAWFEQLTGAERLIAVAYVPVIRLVGDVAKMLGFPVGVWLRLVRREHLRVTGSR